MPNTIPTTWSAVVKNNLVVHQKYHYLLGSLHSIVNVNDDFINDAQIQLPIATHAFNLLIPCCLPL
jgi:hypothetical protein